MKDHRMLIVMLGLGLSLVLVVGLAGAQAQGPATGKALSPSAPLGTDFTYQGQLKADGEPVDARCDMRFILYDAAVGGSQVGPLNQITGVELSDGLFTARLDFGAAVYTGDARWLGIAVRCPAGSGTYVTLTPRQELTAAPYALHSLSAPWSGLSGVPAGFADGIDDDTTYRAGSGLTLSGRTFAVDTAAIQRRVNGTCASGNAIRVVNADGTVTCERVDGGGPHDHWGENWSGGGTGLTLSGGDTGLAASGSNYGLRGTVAAASGAGVYGLVTSSSGLTYGVRGWSQSTAGYGVHGRASASSGTTYGVYGQADSTDGRAVFGWATARGGVTYGVYGRSDSASNGAAGVYGYASRTSGDISGVYGRSDSTSIYSAGVYGYANATTGIATGVIGLSRATTGSGLVGQALATSGHTRGVWGTSFSVDGYGGFFENVNNLGGRGLYAGGGRDAPDIILGAANLSNDNGRIHSDPLYASSDIVVVSNDAIQLELDNDNDEAGNLWLLNGANVTVFAVNEDGDTWARGTKGAAVTTEVYGSRKLYAVESPEVWFEDFGTAQLVNGRAVVTIEPVFAQTVNLAEGYHVYLTPLGDCPLYVPEKAPQSFTVKAMGGQACNIAFDYRLVAKRLGYEHLRLEAVPLDAEEVSDP